MAVAATPPPADPRVAALERAIKLLKAGDTETALKELRAYVKANDGEPDGHYFLARAWVLQGEDGKGCKEYKRYIELAPSGQFAPDAKLNIKNCE